MHRFLVKNIYAARKVRVKRQGHVWVKTTAMFCGIIIMGLSIALVRLSDFGTDPFTCMNLGISSCLPLSFGTWQLLLNAVILGGVMRQGKSFLGLGTIVNMAAVGYLSDLFSWVFRVQGYMNTALPMSGRIIILISSILLTTLGVAFYMAADMGVAPYDACGLIIEKKTNGRIPFRVSRIATDIVCVAIGFFCGSTAGGGTLILALFTGPLVQYLKEKVAVPLIYG